MMRATPSLQRWNAFPLTSLLASSFLTPTMTTTEATLTLHAATSSLSAILSKKTPRMSSLLLRSSLYRRSGSSPLTIPLGIVTAPTRGYFSSSTPCRAPPLSTSDGAAPVDGNPEAKVASLLQNIRVQMAGNGKATTAPQPDEPTTTRVLDDSHRRASPLLKKKRKLAYRTAAGGVNVSTFAPTPSTTASTSTETPSPGSLSSVPYIAGNAVTMPATSPNTETVFLNLRGACYVDAATTQALREAHRSEGFVCPLWATKISMERCGLSLIGTGRPVTVHLSSGESVQLFNIEETSFFVECRAAAMEDGVAEQRTGVQWAEHVLRALRSRDGAQRREAVAAEWHAVPRNVCGDPLSAFVSEALRHERQGALDALQRVSPIWVEAAQARALGMSALPGEEGNGVLLRTSPPHSSAAKHPHHRSANGASSAAEGDESAPVDHVDTNESAAFRAPLVWYHLSQLHPHPTLKFTVETCRAMPRRCLNAEGVSYRLVTACLLRAYCQQWGYRSVYAVFVTPERLAQRRGAVLQKPEDRVVPPFTMMASGEVLTLWNTEQTSLHQQLHEEAMVARRAQFEATAATTPTVTTSS